MTAAPYVPFEPPKLLGWQEGACACDTEKCAQYWIEYLEPKPNFSVHGPDPEKCRILGEQFYKLWMAMTKRAYEIEHPPPYADPTAPAAPEESLP